MSETKEINKRINMEQPRQQDLKRTKTKYDAGISKRKKWSQLSDSFFFFIKELKP